MKRDMDLVRLILLFVEQQGTDNVNHIVIDGYSPIEIREPVKLMKDHNLVSNCKFDMIETIKNI